MSAIRGWLKRKPMIDVLILANMYTLRVLAGGVAANVPVSEWLLAFSTFFFLSLAFVKRYSELIRLAGEQQPKAAGRGYAVSDLSLIETMGPCSGYLSVLVLALYINSDQVKNLYPHSNLLWILCALLLYWISRLWFWAKRGELLEDPVVFAITDRTSLIVAAIGVSHLCRRGLERLNDSAGESCGRAIVGLGELPCRVVPCQPARNGGGTARCRRCTASGKATFRAGWGEPMATPR